MYDLKVHGKVFEIVTWCGCNQVVGQGMAKKLHCPWSGPFKIIKKFYHQWCTKYKTCIMYYVHNLPVFMSIAG